MKEDLEEMLNKMMKMIKEGENNGELSPTEIIRLKAIWADLKWTIDQME